MLNLCGRTVRVKVLIAFGPDSECHTLAEGGGLTHTYGLAGRFDGLVTC